MDDGHPGDRSAHGNAAATSPGEARARAVSASSPSTEAGGWIATGVAVVALGITLGGWLGGGWAVDLPWAPTLGIRFNLALDGLAVLYALLATGIGAVVFVYATAYVPRHLAARGRPSSDARGFWGWMVVFMVSMVGLAASQDLVLLFVFFDLTALASYFLIGFDRDRADARGAAHVALVVTAGSAVAMLIGAVVLHATYGTWSVPAIAAAGSRGAVTTIGCGLIAIAALGKSAQVPLHFWLPRAMAAPTPVSAYLHSAAMVAAGVLVLGRIHPIMAEDSTLLGSLVVVGFASMFVGGVLALAQDELKQVLANSTISQYGYVVVLYGLAGPEGAAGAAFYVLAHGIAKCALFLAAGCVTEATGESRLSRLGGLGREMPVLAVCTAVAAASVAGLPLTLGFFKDELFFGAATEAGVTVAGLATLGAALSVAYLGRFWWAVFAGRGGTRPLHRVPLAMLAPVAALAGLSFAGGIVVGPFADLAAAAASVIHGAAVDVGPAYHVDARPGNLMALGAWTLGIVALALPGVRDAVAGWLARAGDRYGPRHLYGLTLDAVDRISQRVHRAEVRDLRTSLEGILVPTAVLAALGFAATPTDGSYRVGPIAVGDLPVVVLLVLAVAAGVTVARDTGRLRPVLALSVLGFALATVYAIVGAPEVALVAVVIETVLSIVFVAVFARLPAAAITERLNTRQHPRGRYRAVAAGVIAGVTAFGVIWAALSRPPLGVPDSAAQIRLTPAAHGGDVVTVILADFRGLDTMVEITVLMVAVVGVTSLLRRERGG